MTASPGEASDDEQPINLFQEPEGYYPAEKPSTTANYQFRSGGSITLRLVGHSPLWGHLLWNAAKVVASYLEERAETLVKRKTVLELGAGAGLPSLVCAYLGASKVVVTDYPETNLIENLRYNIDHCDVIPDKSAIVAEGFLWGDSITSLQAQLPPGNGKFDLLILADILFNHSEHAKLIRTVKEALSSESHARALVFFTPYRPWLLESDLHFFELAKDAGFRVEKILQYVMDQVMFDNDPGDELLRRTVFGYELSIE